jgi:hypothetical protein
MPAGPQRHRAQHLHVAARVQARRNRRPLLTYRQARSGTSDRQEGCRTPGPWIA